MRPDRNPDVSDLEEPRTTPGDPFGDSTRPRFSGDFPDVFTGYFVQQNGAGGAVFVGGGDLHRGSIRSPGRAAVVGGNRGRCTPVVLFRGGGRGGAVPDRRESPGQNSWLETPSVAEETEAREVSNA